MVQRFLLPFAALVAAAVIGGVVSVGVWQVLEDGRDAAGNGAAPAAEVPARPAVSPAGDSIADVVERALPGVVHVSVPQGAVPRPPGGLRPPPEREEPGEEPPFGLPRPTATGSGFLVDPRHVVTNQHVVRGAETVAVRFHDGDEVEARVVGTDPSTDVALLELPEEHDGAAALPLGSTSDLRIGDPVIAIGSPFGLQGTVTSGIVSALDRDIRAPDGFTIDGAIQTDAALNQGNSGGPLLDRSGRVVGMNAQIASETGVSAGVGYAIPIETVRAIAEELERHGEVQHAYLGVMIEDGDGGARVVEVVEGSPADRAGLEADDVVIRAAGERVTTSDELRAAVSERSPGDELELRIRRGDAEETVTVELGRRPAPSE